MSMNVQIFYLKDEQEDLCQDIVALLKEHAFRNIEMQPIPIVISDDYNIESNTDQHKNFKLYVSLLKASMIKCGDFTIIVSDDEGRWCYAGGGGYGYEGDPEGLNLLYLYTRTLSLAFPAVAVMDRMIMVPVGIHEALSGDLPWLLKPLEVGGVMLVDFGDRDWLIEVARQVGIWLKTEIAKLCRRHMLARRFPNPNFDKLAELVNIDKNYLEQHQNEILAFTPLVELTAKIVSGPAQRGKQSLVTVDIQNESETVLERVHVLVRSPGMGWAGTLEPLVVGIRDFPPRGGGYDLRLMSSVNDVSGIPTEGKWLIIVAAVHDVLHFRIFDGDGKMVVDTDEKRLTDQAQQIENLKKQLESVWPPHGLTSSEKDWVITAVASIVGHTPRGTQTIQFGVTPKEVPYCPLEIRFEMSGTSEMYVRSSIPLILDVSP